MKISASVFSDKSRPLKEVIEDLVRHQVELLHVDCNDDLSVFGDIQQIRTWCNLPIDLHIITPNPSKFYLLLQKTPVEYVTFQVEDLEEELEIPDEVQGKKGLAIITPTPIDVFEKYVDFDFILIMATIPGQSGGKFDKVNFDKIRKFRKMFPTKSIHVDGGVNDEVSFILRNMGVTTSVSGSYLFKEASIGNALMNLTKRSINSHFKVQDFMTPLDEAPSIKRNELSLKTVLSTIEKGNLGFCLVLENDNKFVGLISNADVRRGLLQNLANPAKMDMETIVNSKPISILDTSSVKEMLQLVKNSPFTISYLPVVTKNGKARGIVNFANLIKGEL